MTEPDDLAARMLAAAPPAGGVLDLGELACLAKLRARREPPRFPEIAGFVVMGTVGQGAFGTVYRARHPRLGRDVALKVVPNGLRFAGDHLREAVMLARLDHPNIVQVHDVLEHSLGTVIAMQLVVGESLAAWQRRPHGWREVLAAYLDVGDGLVAAHAAGVLHLDLKPANVLRGSDGRARIVDFGLARHLDDDPELETEPDAPASGAVEGASATDASGRRTPRGTIPYSSPEQRRRAIVGPGADQFSFCVALLEALHGRLPFTAAELRALGFAGHAQPFAAATGRIPRRLDRVLARGLSPDPHRRWPSMAELVAELRRPGWLERPSAWLGIGMVSVAALWLVVRGGEAEAACADPDAALAGIWDAEVAAGVHQAFAAVAAPWASELDRRVSARIDTHVDELRARMHAACEDTRSPGASALAWTRLACLQRESVALGVVTGRLAAGDRDELARADDLVDLLRSPSTCVGASVPADPAARDRLDHARVELTMGHPGTAEAEARRALELAIAADDRGTQAEAWLWIGRSRAAAGHDDVAGDAFEQATALAIASARDEVAVAAWRGLGLAAWRRDDVDDAGRWLQLAEAGVERLGRPPRELADALDARGDLLRMQGELAGAEAAHRAALEQLALVLDRDDPRWAESWLGLAGVLVAAGRLDEAAALDRDTLALRERTLGPWHPATADACLGLAIVLHAAGGRDVALVELARARAILEASFGRAAPQLAPVLTKQAEIWLETGDHARARAAAQIAWDLQREHLPLTHAERIHGAIVILMAIAEAEDDSEGWLALARVARAEAVARDDDAFAATIDIGIASSLRRLGRIDEAAAIYERLSAIPAADPMQRAYVLAGLGAMDLLRGRRARAIERLGAAVVAIEALGAGHAVQLAETRADLAAATRARRD